MNKYLIEFKELGFSVVVIATSVEVSRWLTDSKIVSIKVLEEVKA